MTHKEYQRCRRTVKHFHKGDIVYWIRSAIDSKHEIMWGVVDDEFTDGVLVSRYVVKDYQTCDGVPVTEMQFPTSWKQLPKGWTYNTVLFERGVSLVGEELEVANKFIRGEYNRDKEMLKGMITEGLLVPAYETMHFDNGHVETEIEQGRFRLVYQHNKWTHEIGQMTYRWQELYDTYDEAQAVVDAEIAECRRISNLSDYEYAVWDMDDRLSKWRTPNMSDEFITEIREWLLKLDDFEDYEFRGTSGGFQYKKANNKKWLTVGISTDRSRW